jgi:hypothetical protein
MTQLPDVDPYGGYREGWTQDVLNAASQDAGIVFDHPVVRAAPLTNQITLPTIAHFEACGPTAMAICAYACGLINDPAGNAVAGCNFLGAASVAASGTGTGQLLSWAANQGWKVHQDNRPAGDLDVFLLNNGLIGTSALDTAYGTGASWNTLHPAAGGRIGHWEVFGAVSGPPVQEENLVGWMDPGPANQPGWQTARRVKAHEWGHMRGKPLSGEPEMDQVLAAWVANGAEAAFALMMGI